MLNYRLATVKKTTFALFGIIVFFFGIIHTPKAQTIELLAGNTLNGAMNGVLLGGATMALQNSNDFDPVRIGVGLGTIYGMGVGVYDITTTSIGEQFYISGTFNDGTNSSILILLDTFYGAVAGAALSASVAIIGNNPVLEGLQYGSGVGAWIGFGFGLIDSFTLAKRFHQKQNMTASAVQTGGLLRYSNSEKNIALGMLNPTIISRKEVTGSRVNMHHSFGVELINLNITL